MSFPVSSITRHPRHDGRGLTPLRIQRNSMRSLCGGAHQESSQCSQTVPSLYAIYNMQPPICLKGRSMCDILYLFFPKGPLLAYPHFHSFHLWLAPWHNTATQQATLSALPVAMTTPPPAAASVHLENTYVNILCAHAWCVQTHQTFCSWHIDQSLTFFLIVVNLYRLGIQTFKNNSLLNKLCI